ncbi:MAG: hypothetical protein IJ264_06485 [Clostridia bacterium]|nr:hypothetical protein [Clostridia bacterium]
MAEIKRKQNTAAQNHGSKKPLVVAVSVICALLVLLSAFLIFKDPFYFSLAKSKSESGNFVSALNIASKSTDEKAELFCGYLALRIDINENYPLIVSDFDIERINGWSERASALNQKAQGLDEEFSAEIALLDQRLSRVVLCYYQYQAIRSDVLALMDVFAEFNRLYSVASDGKNTAFTVSEELAKIAAWEQQNSNLMAFAATVPGYEEIYLLNYLIKEAQAECGDLREAMDSVVAMGYSGTDLIRLSGSAQKKFPGIQNSNGESVNVLEKGRYESFMFDGICRKLSESLGEFYIINES